MMPEAHLMKPGKKFHLKDLSTRGKDYHDDRDQVERELKRLRIELDELQTRLYAENEQKLLVVFQAMDAGGKDGTTRSVFKEVNPQGVRITSFKEPSEEELSHDFLWRIHQEVPGKGMIGVFNRSHYEDVLVVRVNHLVPEQVWRARYDQINNFEKMLMETGTRILKFFLHISREDQKESFEDRIKDPKKHWKFALGDLEKRKQWDDYMDAYTEAISRCTTEETPWYVIPGDQNWYRNWAVAKIIVATLKDMNPRFPPLPPEYADLKID